jgi:hypothetical protein
MELNDGIQEQQMKLFSCAIAGGRINQSLPAHFLNYALQ